MTEPVALVDPVLVVDAGVNVDVPSAGSPVAAIEIRLSVPVFCIGRAEMGCGEDAVVPEATVPLDAPAMGNWGRFVSFR